MTHLFEKALIDSLIAYTLLLNWHILDYIEVTKHKFLSLCFQDPSEVAAVSAEIQPARVKHNVCFSTTAACPWLSSKSVTAIETNSWSHSTDLRGTQGRGFKQISQ